MGGVPSICKFTGIVMRRILFLLSFFLVQAHAADVAAPNAFDRFMATATGVGKQTVNFGGTGVPLPAPGVPRLATDGGLLLGTGSGSLTNPSGNPLPVSGAVRIPGSEVAKAVGRAAAKIIGPLAVGSALWDLYKELNYDYSVDSAGSPVVKKSDPTICSVAPCTSYQFRTAPVFTTYQAACASGVGMGQSTGFGWMTYISLVDAQPWGCKYLMETSDHSVQVPSDYNALAAISVPAASSNLVLSSQQEFLDAVAARSGWPTGSTIAQALVDAGVQVTTHPVIQGITLSGPATSPGTTTVTNNTTNNTTKTETTTHNHTYAGPTVTTTTTTVTNIVNNTTGDTISNETTTSEPAPAVEQKETCGLPGTPACKIDETGTPAAPDLKPDVKAAEVYKPLTDFAADPKSKLPTFPTLNWAFTLPSGCTAISIPAFAPFLQAIDICQFTPMFHDVMTVVWVMGGLFGAIGTFWRNTFSQA